MAFPRDLFGFTISGTGKPIAPTSEPQKLPSQKVAKSFAPPDYDDGATPVQAGAHLGSFVDMDGTVKNHSEQIRKYRNMALVAEVEAAVHEICDDAIVMDDDVTAPIALDLEGCDLPISIEKRLKEEFSYILRMLKFNAKGYDLFKKWYVDGRLFFHKITDPNEPKKGLIEIRPIDALRIRKIRNISKSKGKDLPLTDISQVEEFYLYNEIDETQSRVFVTGSVTGVKVAPDSICFVPSGLLSPDRKKVMSYLHKAIKPLNQLKMIEDASVIYRLARAPERRIFYIDVGNLPKNKAEAYMKEIMNRYRNKLVYDATTGELKDDRQHMTMLEDFWLPRREGGKGTEIDNLQGGANLGTIEDIEYFQKKLDQALSQPSSRKSGESGFNMGRSSEINRDEIRFFKFIQRLRRKFNHLFVDLLRTQCILKGIMKPEDWDEIEDNLAFIYKKDSTFSEQQENETLQGRFNLLEKADSYLGKYFSKERIQKKILRLSDEEIAEIEMELEREKDAMAKKGIDPDTTSYSLNGAAGPTVLEPTPLKPQQGDIAAQELQIKMQAQSDQEMAAHQADLDRETLKHEARAAAKAKPKPAAKKKK